MLILILLFCLIFEFRFVDLTEWATGGSHSNPAYYYGVAAATIGTMGLGWYVWNNRPEKIIPLVNPQSQTRELPVWFFYNRL